MKIKKIFLSIVLMLSMLCAVACKDKKDDTTDTPPPATKADSVVHVSVEDRVFLVGEKLADIELLMAVGDTSGTVEWDNENYVLVLGDNNCNWTFTPTDTSSYKAKTGTMKISAVNLDIPQVSNVGLVPDQTVYVDQKYEGISLQGEAKFNGETVEGTFSWVEPTKTFEYGENSCSWKFVPTESSVYAVVYGTTPITVSAIDYQYPTEISVTASKLEYEAYQTLTINTITICQKYNAGKEEIVDFEREDLTITYLNGDSFRRGDTKVKIDYRGIETELENLVVDYAKFKIPEPLANPKYSGTEQTLTVQENPAMYTIVPVKATDAGDYKIQLTLVDTDNYKWENGDLVTTEVACTIHKADIVLSDVKEIVAQEFDNSPHSASVSNQTGHKVFYSEEILNEENYSRAGNEELIEKINAGTYTVYYFIEGDTNYNSKTGSLSIEILKQKPTMLLQECYTLKTGSIVTYPQSYISIVDKQENNVELDGLTLTYYRAYSDDSNSSNDIKTTSEDGAVKVGGAPRNERASEYYVVVGYAGSQNYEAVQEHTVLFIDGSNLELYAKSNEDAFAFKYSSDEFYTATNTFNSKEYTLNGSRSECNAYLEFNEKALDEDGLRVVEISSKFGAGSRSIENGRLVFVDGSYCFRGENGSLYAFSFNSESKEIEIQLGDAEEDKVTLRKWVLPKYLKTFTAQTISDEDFTKEGYDQTKNSSQNTEITFYNDYGTIRFSAKINVLYKKLAVGEKGGYLEWSGVAESLIDYIDGRACYILNCYVITTESLNSSGYEKMEEGFKLVWEIPLTGEEKPEPDEMKASIAIGSSLLSSPCDVLIGKTYKLSDND